MNRIKSKENLNIQEVKSKPIKQGIKTRNQQKKSVQQKPISKIAKKAGISNDSNILHVRQPSSVKQIPAQLHYVGQISNLILTQSTTIFTPIKPSSFPSNYIKYRSFILQTLYKQSLVFELKRKTFYLTIFYLDNFMTKCKNQLFQDNQLLVASYTSFFVAMKYQEIYPPSIEDWIPSTLVQQVYLWEAKLIYKIDFRFIVQTVQHFLEFWAYTYQLDSKQLFNCQMTLDLMLFTQNIYGNYSPPKLAKAIVLFQISQKQKDLKNVPQIFDSPYQQTKILTQIGKMKKSYPVRMKWIQDKNQK